MGACHTGRHAIVSTAFPHFGEESVLQVPEFFHLVQIKTLIACSDLTKAIAWEQIESNSTKATF